VLFEYISIERIRTLSIIAPRNQKTSLISLPNYSVTSYRFTHKISQIQKSTFANDGNRLQLWHVKTIYKQALLLIFLFVAAGTIFGERYLELSLVAYAMIGIVLTYMIRMGEVLDARMTATFGFFALLHWMRPVNEKVTELLQANVDGTYFIGPILLFTLALILFPSIRASIDWWKIDNFDRKTNIQLMLAILLGCGAMYIYVIYNQESLARFIGMLPQGSLLKILFLGIVFSLLNAVVEEYIIRGMVWNGLSKIFSNTLAINLIQASMFGASHYFGLPGGITGVALVFFWSLIMGHFRIKSGGIITVIIAHFALNLFEYFILYSF
jgi:membrane protease YdiL (CAAX protease family)